MTYSESLGEKTGGPGPEESQHITAGRRGDEPKKDTDRWRERWEENRTQRPEKSAEGNVFMRQKD